MTKEQRLVAAVQKGLELREAQKRYAVDPIDFDRSPSHRDREMLAYISNRLEYSPLTGTFLWLLGPDKGKRAGYLRKMGYRAITVLRRTMMEHHIACLFMLGYTPKPPACIDHINGKKDDNRYENLRFVTRAENARNTPSRSRAMSKFTGVAMEKRTGKWRGCINGGGKQVSLGAHASELIAAQAYDIAADALYGRYARLNFGAPTVVRLEYEFDKLAIQALRGDDLLGE